ncbi:unnamed protein product [Amaranthus hypochondriacus]
MRDRGGKKFETTLVTKSSYQKRKGKLVNCNHCHKNGHKENDCWHKRKLKCYNCKRFGHMAKNFRFKNDEKETMAQVVIEENLL